MESSQVKVVSRAKVVVQHTIFANLDPTVRALGEAGIVPVQLKTRDAEEVMAEAREADAIIVQSFPMTRSIIAQLTRCRIIAVSATGYDGVDLAAATEAGIVVTNVPAYCTPDVADHTMALLLSCVRRLPLLYQAVREAPGDYVIARPIPRLEGSTLGIVGLGRIGKAVARRALGFGMRVLAYDPYLSEETFREHGTERRERLSDLLSESDFVTLHCALTKETTGLLGEAELGAMKRGAILINAARGAVVDYQALERFLESGHVGAAGLDVFHPEPVTPDNPLLRFPNVIATPHIAWYSEGSEEELLTAPAREVLRMLRGERPLNPVNPSVLDSSARFTIPRR